MGNILQTSPNGTTMFPPELTNELFNLVRGKSSLARLSASRPIPFRGETAWTFTLDKEVDIVAENGAKSNGGATMGQKTITPIKVEYGVRVSDEFLYASNEIQLDYLRAFSEGFANKVARGIDIMAFHGLNPRTASASALIGSNHFDSEVTQTVSYSALTANDNVTAAIEMIQGNEHEATGMAMAPAFRSALANLKKGSSSYEALYPELAWGANPDTLNGLPVDTNSTVSFAGSDDMAIVGNFRDFFRWGYARQIPIEIIQFGNPDNDADAGDLKGHNQIYIRGEAYIGWGILVPDAFARIGSFSVGVAAAPESADTVISFGDLHINVSDIQDNVTMMGNNFYGNLKYIEDGLSPTGPLAGSGNFLAVKFDGPAFSTATAIKVGLDPSVETGLVDIKDDPDRNAIMKISDKDQKLVVEVETAAGKSRMIYNLNTLTYATA